jgi:hypothetical protein
MSVNHSGHRFEQTQCRRIACLGCRQRIPDVVAFSRLEFDWLLEEARQMLGSDLRKHTTRSTSSYPNAT